MSFEFNITRQAQRDIDRNSIWWANQHSTEQATNRSNTVYDQLESIPESPLIHSISNENDQIQFELREKLVGLGSKPRYRALFMVKDNMVYVLSVRAAEQGAVSPDEIEFS